MMTHTKQTNMKDYSYILPSGYTGERTFDLTAASVAATWTTTNSAEYDDRMQILRVDDSRGTLHLLASRNYASSTIRYDLISDSRASQMIEDWREQEADRLILGWHDWRSMYRCTFA